MRAAPNARLRVRSSVPPDQVADFAFGLSQLSRKATRHVRGAGSIEEAQAASGPAGGVSREAAANTGVAVILKEREATSSASSWNALQRNPYCSRSVGGSRAAVDNRCAGTNTRKGAGRRASRITAATSFAGAVTAIVSPAI